MKNAKNKAIEGKKKVGKKMEPKKINAETFDRLTGGDFPKRQLPKHWFK